MIAFDNHNDAELKRSLHSSKTRISRISKSISAIIIVIISPLSSVCTPVNIIISSNVPSNYKLPLYMLYMYVASLIVIWMYVYEPLIDHTIVNFNLHGFNWCCC